MTSPGPPAAGLLSVRTEVVLDVLVGSIAEAVAERLADALPAAVETALGRAGDVLGDAGTAARRGHAAQVARCGWHARQIERERFERAREEPGHELAARLSDAAACVELARREPLGRPAPDDRDATTWRVPGPGGHVRHYLAARAVEELPPADRAAELKRAWAFGFLLACLPAMRESAEHDAV